MIKVGKNLPCRSDANCKINFNHFCEDKSKFKEFTTKYRFTNKLLNKVIFFVYNHVINSLKNSSP